MSGSIDIESLGAESFALQPLPKLMTVEEAAMNIHETVRPSAIRAAIRRKDLSATKIGRRFYIEHGELKRYISCHVKENRHGSSNERTTELGSSSMAANTSGQDLVKGFVSRQKKH